MKIKTITAVEYNKIMDEIIRKNKKNGVSIKDTLIELLEEAAKYKLIGLKRKSKQKTQSK